jgi:hypothetical protein
MITNDLPISKVMSQKSFSSCLHRYNRSAPKCTCKAKNAAQPINPDKAKKGRGEGNIAKIPETLLAKLARNRSHFEPNLEAHAVELASDVPEVRGVREPVRGGDISQVSVVATEQGKVASEAHVFSTQSLIEVHVVI